jgi:hypothetical protein
MKSGMQTYRYFFLAAYAFRRKVLGIDKKIRDPEKNLSLMPYPGGKKAPHPGSATLYRTIIVLLS